jgi:hypothetical protein
METRHKLLPAAEGSTFKNMIWALPFLAVMGMIWGYLAAAGKGAVVGLFFAAAADVIIAVVAGRTGASSKTNTV